ncbi:MAG: hypothetical protein IKW90_14370, partial [Lachnospiraceae bacterium]|nr:hypothetical protein [Lachnospiraceae bacterium]
LGMRVGIMFLCRSILRDAVVFTGACGCKAALFAQGDKHPVDGGFGAVRVYGVDCFAECIFIENLSGGEVR